MFLEDIEGEWGRFMWLNAFQLRFEKTRGKVSLRVEDVRVNGLGFRV